MRIQRAVAVILCLGLLGLGAAAFADGSRMWYRGYFEGPVDTRTNPQPGYYYHPSPNTTMPLFERSHTYPLICPRCRAYYYPGEASCDNCHSKLPGRAQGVDDRTVYRPYRLPGQYYYEEQPHYTYPTASKNIGPGYIRYNNRWD